MFKKLNCNISKMLSENLVKRCEKGRLSLQSLEKDILIIGMSMTAFLPCVLKHHWVIFNQAKGNHYFVPNKTHSLWVTESICLWR